MHRLRIRVDNAQEKVLMRGPCLNNVIHALDHTVRLTRPVAEPPGWVPGYCGSSPGWRDMPGCHDTGCPQSRGTQHGACRRGGARRGPAPVRGTGRTKDMGQCKSQLAQGAWIHDRSVLQSDVQACRQAWPASVHPASAMGPMCPGAAIVHCRRGGDTRMTPSPRTNRNGSSRFWVCERSQDRTQSVWA